MPATRRYSEDPAIINAAESRCLTQKSASRGLELMPRPSRRCGYDGAMGQGVCVPIFGCGDAITVSAWAALALAGVGIVSIVANIGLVVVTWRMAKAQESAIELEKRQLDLGEAQLQVGREQVEQRERELAADERARREELDRETAVDLEVIGPAGSERVGTLARIGPQIVTVRNRGRGSARDVTVRLRSAKWGSEPSDPVTLQSGESTNVGFEVAESHGLTGTNMVVSITYTDEASRTWEMSRVGANGPWKVEQR